MKTFEYDIAISFAEEDRNAALALTRTLALNGIKKVYYYPDFLEATTGRPLKAELLDIYGRRAKFAVALLSKDYFKKDYTRLEMEAIRKRMERKNNKVYLIPVLMNQSVIKFMPEIKELGYLHWDADPDRIAALLCRKLGTKLSSDDQQKQKKLIDSVLQKQSGGVLLQQSGDINQAIMVVNNHGQIDSIINKAIKNGK